MAGLPTVQVLLDDGTGAFPYDITTYAQLVPGYKVKRGRQDELANVTPGDMALVLDNTDGRFTLGSTIIATPSPIQVDAKVRIKVTANATVFTRSTTHVQSWPVEWPKGGDTFAVAAISGTDVQAKGERQPLRSNYVEEVSKDAPTAIDLLTESGTVFADVSGNQAASLTVTGAGTAITPGTALSNGIGGVTFAGGQFLTGPAASADASNGGWIGLWFQRNSVPAAAEAIWDPTDGAGIVIGMDTSGRVGSLASATMSSGSYADGVAHHLVVVWGANGSLGTFVIYVDGVAIGTTNTPVIGASAGSTASWLGGQGPTGASSPASPVPFSGLIGGVASRSLSSVVLSAARVAAHYAAGSNYPGESGTARITRLAGYAGLPLGTLDASLTNLASGDITGKSVIEAIRDAADAELGLVFVDASGNVTFHNRNRAISKLSPDVTIDANFLAEGTRFIVDMQGVINYFETTAAGTKVTQVARDTVSENGDGTAAHPKHGRYPQSKTYLVQTDAEALDRANWIIFTHAQPSPRVGSLVVDVLTMTAAQQAAMLGLEANSWLRVTGLPGQTPGSTTADFIVQGWSEALNANEWTLTLNAANKAVAAPDVWILGDTTRSVLGSTTRLGV